MDTSESKININTECQNEIIADVALLAFPNGMIAQSLSTSNISSGCILAFSEGRITDYQTAFIKYTWLPVTKYSNNEKFSCLISNISQLIIKKENYKKYNFKNFQSQCLNLMIESNKTLDCCLEFGIQMFCIFMRNNFSGPKLTKNEMKEWDQFWKCNLFDSNDISCVKCHNWLKIDNEDISFELYFPFTLVFANVLIKLGLELLLQDSEKFQSKYHKCIWQWWKLRVIKYHQSILANPVPTFREETLKLHKELEDEFTNNEESMKCIFTNVWEFWCKDNKSARIESDKEEKEEKHEKKKNKQGLNILDLVKCQFHIEYALAIESYWMDALFSEQIIKAKRCIGIENRNDENIGQTNNNYFDYEFTAQLGKRTKFQEKSFSQFYVDIKSSIWSDFASINDETWFLPQNMALNDETLLDQTKYDDSQMEKKSVDKLHYLEHCILLLDIKKITMMIRVKDIREIKILSYIESMTRNNDCLINDYSIQFSVLYLRCLYEMSNNYKTVRAIQQLEQLIVNLTESSLEHVRSIPKKYEKQVKGGQNKEEILSQDDMAVLSYKRLIGIYGCFPMLKCQSAIECDLANMYYASNFNQSALNIYEKLNVYHKIVECLMRINRKNDAKLLIEKQISKIREIMETENNDNGDDIKNSANIKIDAQYSVDKLPYYLCLLGDICEDIKYYEMAWNESNGHYAQSQRSLAKYYYFDKKDYQKAIECCRLALNINSLFPQAWFLMGHSALKLKPNCDYSTAIEAFSFVVGIDPDNFEAWNNLGASHMKLENWKSALWALNEAGKLQRKSWQIWENILTCALKLKNVSKSISTMSHLIDLNINSSSINETIIGTLALEMTNIILSTQNTNDNQDNTVNESEIQTEKKDQAKDQVDIQELFSVKMNEKGNETDSDNKNNNDNDDDNKNDENEDENEEENDDDDGNGETETKQLSKEAISLIARQFDELMSKIITQVFVTNSFKKGSNHIADNPFKKLDNNIESTKLSENKEKENANETVNEEKQSETVNQVKDVKEKEKEKEENVLSDRLVSMFEIYEIYCVYLANTNRVEEGIKTRLKQRRDAMRSFDTLIKTTAKYDKKIIGIHYKNVLSCIYQLSCLYHKQIETMVEEAKDENKEQIVNEIKKIEQSITSMELNRNRINKLTQNQMIDLCADELKNTNDQLNSLTALALKTKTKFSKKEETTSSSYDFMSSFSDWR